MKVFLWNGIFGVAFILAFNPVCADHWVYQDSERSPSQKTALIIMNGFGGSKSACKAQFAFWKEQGMDVFIPEVLLRPSLESSSVAMEEFIAEYGIAEYAEVRSICYIAGAFLLHTYLESHALPSLRYVIYDRSPIQERAPQAVMTAIPVLGTWMKGKVLKDLSEAVWPAPIVSPSVITGLAIENRATGLMRWLQDEAEALGPFEFDWKKIDSNASDAFHVALDHDMMYTRWDILGAPFLHFFAHGVFPEGVSRGRLTDHPFDKHQPIPE